MVGEHQPMPIGRQAGSASSEGAAHRQDRSARRDRPPGCAARRSARSASSSKDRSRLRQGTATRGTMTCTGPAEVLMHKAGTQAGMTRQQSLQPPFAAGRSPAGPPDRAPVAPYRRRAPAHHTAHGTAGPPAAEPAAGCPRSRIAPLQPLDLGLRQRQQRQIGRAAAASPRRPRMAHQRFQRSEPALRQIANLSLRHQRRRPRPRRREPWRPQVHQRSRH